MVKKTQTVAYESREKLLAHLNKFRADTQILTPVSLTVSNDALSPPDVWDNIKSQLTEMGLEIGEVNEAIGMVTVSGSAGALKEAINLPCIEDADAEKLERRRVNLRGMPRSNSQTSAWQR